MTTQLLEARAGRISPAMKKAAESENVPPEKVLEEVRLGRAVIPLNPAHTLAEPTIVGRAFRTKINANIGRSASHSSRSEELKKMTVAIESGADFLMDLSVGPETVAIRDNLLKHCRVPLGTVPMYEAFVLAQGKIDTLTGEMLLSVVREQAKQGVDFMTIHAGLLKDHVKLACQRRLGIVSRGGAILAEWMVQHNCENPFYTRWDEVLDICVRHDVTLSIGDGLRPGCLADASDAAQFAELDTLGELVRRSRAHGVQVMVEGPGHIPFDQIQMNMERQRKICDGAPFYVLGPVVTDIAPGYDHITSCIGATAAAYHGAALLCYVTPSEHLGLPTLEEVKTGVIAYRIAAHAADVALKIPGARDRDDQMADARRDFDWERQFSLSLDPDGARKRYEQTRSPVEGKADHCSMCGKDFCAIRTSKRISQR